MEKRGSVTVFSALTLMLVASFLFALLEAGRVNGLQEWVEMTSELGLESVCAEYQPGLWEGYHLLCLDGAYGGDAFSMEQVSTSLRNRLEKNLEPAEYGTNFFALEITEVAPMQYQVLTDEDGAVFLKRIADYMQTRLPEELAEKLYDSYQRQQEIEESESVEDCVETASTALEEARAAALESTGEAVGEVPSADALENPLEIAQEIKRNAILGMVVEDVGKISGKQIDGTQTLLKRTCNQGNATAEEGKVTLVEKVLVLEYLDNYFPDYVAAEEEHPLSYEMEYVLCGKDSDRENLEGAVKHLLRLREAANIIHIVADSEKRTQAQVLAEALAGFTMNTGVIRAVQLGIIAAWSYMESIQDVRALLQGDRIALIKSKEQWTLQLGNLLESFRATSKALSCENGLTYQEYLKGLLLLKKEKVLAYRMMDMMEQRMRTAEGYTDCRMDYMLCDVTYNFTYSGTPLFSRLVTIGNLGSGSYRFYTQKRFSYSE
jgi:hypothetical protein